MLIDCGTCQVRGVACGDCVLTVLWGTPDDAAVPAVAVAAVPVRLDAADRRALAVLADAGLAPRLRHVERPVESGRRAV